MADIYTKADVTRELLRVFKFYKRPFTRREFDAVGDIGFRTVERVFGSWSKALEGSGLEKKFQVIKSVEREMEEFAPEKEIEQDWQARKKVLVEKANIRRLREIEASSHKLDVVKEMIETAVARAEPPMVEVNPIKVLKHKDSAGAEHVTLWFSFSDLQLGTLIEAELMGGLNRHNWVIWQQKLRIWKETAIKKIGEYLAGGYVVDRVILACLGDMVEGQDIFKGQVWQLDRNVADQAIDGANDTAGAFIEIMKTFPEQTFDVLEVFGNHGRSQRKGEAPYSASWDKVYQRLLEVQIRAAGVSNMNYYRNEAWFYLVDIYGWNHLLLHGDQGMAGMWSNRPTINGLEKGLTRYNQLLQQQVHFLHCGHFHNDWGLAFNMSYMLINGSFIGTSQFSASQMVAASPPMQTLHVFSERTGLVRTERIYLTEGPTRVPYEPNRLKS